MSKMVFWQSSTDQTIPTGIWTPLIFNNLISTRWPHSFTPASTTIAAASDLAALPQATINVASTAGFAQSGYIAIRISGTDRVVKYTDKTDTAFTGCTLGVGTMGTGNPVAQANVDLSMPPNLLLSAVAEVAWASHATGVRGIKFVFVDAFAPGISLDGGTTVVGAVATANPLMHIQTAEQPASVNPSKGPTRVDVYQSSGVPLDSVVQLISSPRLVVFDAGVYS